ncbi:hypothetical protein C8R47DRAFT_1202611 [Mycena vitilis]|nr:hypothetical protein C8R47DRAFT_1202611 [Mycena vitilis]
MFRAGYEHGFREEKSSEGREEGRAYATAKKCEDSTGTGRGRTALRPCTVNTLATQFIGLNNISWTLRARQKGAIRYSTRSPRSGFCWNLAENARKKPNPEFLARHAEGEDVCLLLSLPTSAGRQILNPVWLLASEFWFVIRPSRPPATDGPAKTKESGQNASEFEGRARRLRKEDAYAYVSNIVVPSTTTLGLVSKNPECQRKRVEEVASAASERSAGELKRASLANPAQKSRRLRRRVKSPRCFDSRTSRVVYSLRVTASLGEGSGRKIRRRVRSGGVQGKACESKTKPSANVAVAVAVLSRRKLIETHPYPLPASLQAEGGNNPEPASFLPRFLETLPRQINHALGRLSGARSEERGGPLVGAGDCTRPAQLRVPYSYPDHEELRRDGTRWVIANWWIVLVEPTVDGVDVDELKETLPGTPQFHASNASCRKDSKPPRTANPPLPSLSPPSLRRVSGLDSDLLFFFFSRAGYRSRADHGNSKESKSKILLFPTSTTYILHILLNLNLNLNLHPTNLERERGGYTDTTS